MQVLACPCGEQLGVPPGAPSLVCPGCGRMHLVAGELATDETLPAIHFDPRLVPMSTPPADAPPPMPTPTPTPTPAPAPKSPATLPYPDVPTSRPSQRGPGHPERAMQFEATTAHRSPWPWLVALALVVVAAAIAALALA